METYILLFLMIGGTIIIGYSLLNATRSSDV